VIDTESIRDREFQIRAVLASRESFECQECHWRGSQSELTRAENAGGTELACPSCGQAHWFFRGPLVRVMASRRAERYIRRHGGEVFVWSGPGLLQETTTERPEGVDFDAITLPSFNAFVQRGLSLGDWIRVERDPLPPWRLVSFWQGSTRSF
jgi:hypothetical protein